ncbi:MAG: hypothetical protein R2771_03925 [Saprospiraceae bacterium]
MEIHNLSSKELDVLNKKYPYSYLQTLIRNQKDFTFSGDISISEILELADKTENPGLALVNSIKNINSADVSSNNKGADIQTQIEDSNKLNNNIASENLAKIYLKQGLKKEAIEIYKRISLFNNKNNSTFAKF